jgi:ATP-dependent DNA helicase RecG
VSALVTLRLINRANLGVKRMFTEFLAEGKPAPIVSDVGNAVHIAFIGSGFSPTFRAFVAEESRQGHILSLDELLTLSYLAHHAEAETATLAELCQKTEAVLRDSLSVMEQRQYIERGGAGRGTYWRLSHGVRKLLLDASTDISRRRIDWEAAKTRILSVARERQQHGEKGLSNSEVRAITKYDRGQVKRLLNQLSNEGVMELIGQGRRAVWVAK